MITYLGVLQKFSAWYPHKPGKHYIISEYISQINKRQKNNDWTLAYKETKEWFTLRWTLKYLHSAEKQNDYVQSCSQSLGLKSDLVRVGEFIQGVLKKIPKVLHQNKFIISAFPWLLEAILLCYNNW